MTIEAAVEMLRSEYDKAVKSEFVNKPVAYALYQTWKAVDAKEKSREPFAVGYARYLEKLARKNK